MDECPPPSEPLSTHPALVLMLLLQIQARSGMRALGLMLRVLTYGRCWRQKRKTARLLKCAYGVAGTRKER